MSYATELSRELGAVGIRGARCRRILAEVEDHLAESGDPAAFGSPRIVARRFAAELATSGARRSAAGAFVALVPAGLGYAVLVLLLGASGGSPDLFAAETNALGVPAALVLLLAPQVALAAGALAALGASRARLEAAMPAAAVRLFIRRSTVALAAGAATLAALGLYAYEYRTGLADWWTAAAIATAFVAALPLAAAGFTTARTAALQATTAGSAGTAFDDLDPLLGRISLWRRLAFREHPWRFCLLFATVVAIAVSSGPLAAGRFLDEGTKNALAEFLAIVCGFALLGRPLGLRR